MFTGFEFNGQHSYRDFGLTLESRKIGNPSKVKVTERIPYSNIEYDFSKIYGGQEYTEREINYVLNINGRGAKANFYLIETEINQWLFVPSKKMILKDDMIPGFYFLAEVVTNPDDEYLFNLGGKLSITFTAYPFKIANLEEGNDIWDTFNFLLDYAQTTQFNVAGSMDITLYNPSATTVKPVIHSSTSMKIIKNGVTYNVISGTSSSDDFMLNIGENKLKIVGTGSISFHFRKEMI